MSYLMDTNVISAIRKRENLEPRVVEWFRERDPWELYVSVLTLGELLRGVHRIRRRDARQADVLSAWVGRIFDIDVVKRWSRLGVTDPVPDVDGPVAATVPAHDLMIVTRNTKRFAPTGARCTNPFDQALLS